MNHQHQNLASGRWFTLSLAEQLGNVGSEYERALRWKGKNQDYFEKAFERMLELLDLTIQDPRWRNHRLKELLRLREQACEELLAQTLPEATLKKYFLYFGLLARA